MRKCTVNVSPSIKDAILIDGVLFPLQKIWFLYLRNLVFEYLYIVFKSVSIKTVKIILNYSYVRGGQRYEVYYHC